MAKVTKENADSVYTCADSVYTCKEASLELKKQSWSSWKRTGLAVGALVSAAPWYVGDWLLWGERHFGEQSYQAADVTGLSRERLRVLTWVAGRFPPDARRAELSFEAHRELASIRDDEELEAALDMAVKNGWGSKDIRDWKRGRK